MEVLDIIFFFDNMSKYGAIVDLHLDNFGCTLPGLNEHSEEDLMAHFPPPECTVVLTVDPMDQTTSLPPYLVTAISMADYMVNAVPSLPSIEVVPHLKILDFGNGVPLLITPSLRIYNVTQISQRFGKVTRGLLGSAQLRCALQKLFSPRSLLEIMIPIGICEVTSGPSGAQSVFLPSIWPYLILLCIDLRNRFRVYPVLWCGCGWLIELYGEDDRKAPTCMGVILGLT